MTDDEKTESGPQDAHLVKTKQRERHVRKSRKKRETIRTVSRFFLTIALAAGLYYLAICPGWYLDKNAFSYVNSNIIEVSNNKIVPSYKILAILKKNDVPDLPIYLMKTHELKTQIRQLGPVENVYIRRYAFPARLQIIIKERLPVLTISPDLKSPPIAFFTDDDKLIGREYLPLSQDFHTILVLSYGNKGDDYTKWDKAKISEIRNIAKHIEEYSNEPVEYIDMRDPNDVFVKIATTSIRLGKLDNTLYERIARLPSVLPQVKLMNAKVKYVDLSWEKVNYLKLE